MHGHTGLPVPHPGIGWFYNRVYSLIGRDCGRLRLPCPYRCLSNLNSLLSSPLCSAYILLPFPCVPPKGSLPECPPPGTLIGMLTCSLRAPYVALCTPVSWVPIPGRPSLQGTLTGVLTFCLQVSLRETRRGGLRPGGWPGKGVFLPSSLEPGRAPVTA